MRPAGCRCLVLHPFSWALWKSWAFSGALPQVSREDGQTSFVKTPVKPAMMFDFFGKQRFGLKKRWTWMIFAAKCLESCAEDRNLDKHVCSLPRGVRRRLCSCALAAKVSCASCSLKVIKLEHFHQADMNRHDPLESIVAWIAQPGCTWDRLFVCCLPKFWWHLSSSLALKHRRGCF